MTESNPANPIKTLRSAIASQDSTAADQCLEQLSAGEAARAVAHLSNDDQSQLLAILEEEHAAELLEVLPEPQAAQLIEFGGSDNNQGASHAHI